jgi:Cadherin-like beta sandwich domain
MKSIVRTLAVALSSAFLFSSCNSSVQQSTAATESTNELRILPRLADLPTGTTAVYGSLIIDPTGTAPESTTDSVVFTKGSLSFKKKVKKGSTFRLTLAGKNGSLSYNWVIDTLVHTDANSIDSTLLLNLSASTPVTTVAKPVAAAAAPLAPVTDPSYTLKLKPISLLKKQSLRYTTDGTTPNLSSPEFDTTTGLVINHPVNAADTVKPIKVNVSVITDIGSLPAWSNPAAEFVFKFGGTAKPVAHDTTLVSLTCLGTLMPTFNSKVLAYTDSVDSKATSEVFTYTTTDVAAGVTGGVSGKFTVDVSALAEGATQKSTLTVTNGSSKLDYVITIAKKKAAVVVPGKHDTTLSKITVLGGDFSPMNVGAGLIYTDSVAIGATKATVSAVATDAANATVNVNGSTLASTEVTLGATDPTVVTIKVTNGTSSLSYTLNIVHKKSATPAAHDTTLTGILPGTGTLRTKFVSATTSYTDSVKAGTTTEVFHVIRKDPKATVTFNGKADSTISLSKDTTPVAIVVTNGTSTLTYNVTIIRAKAVVVPTDTVLTALSITGFPLTPATFDSKTTSYSLTIDDAVTTLPVTAASNIAGVVNIDGTKGNSKSVSVPAGTTAFTITVTAGSASYTIDVTVKAATKPSAALTGLTPSTGTLSPVFDSATLAYTMSVASTEAGTLTWTATSFDSKATISGNGAVDLSLLAAGTSQTVTITVTGSDKSTKDYVIVIKKSASGGASTPLVWKAPAVTGTGTATYTIDATSANRPGYNQYYTPKAVLIVKSPWSSSAQTGTVTVNGGAPVTIGMNANESIILPDAVCTIEITYDGASFSASVELQ